MNNMKLGKVSIVMGCDSNKRQEQHEEALNELIEEYKQEHSQLTKDLVERRKKLLKIKEDCSPLFWETLMNDFEMRQESINQIVRKIKYVKIELEERMKTRFEMEHIRELQHHVFTLSQSEGEE